MTEQQRLAAINKDEDQLARGRDQEDRRTREERLKKASEAADERRRVAAAAPDPAGARADWLCRAPGDEGLDHEAPGHGGGVYPGRGPPHPVVSLL